MIAQIRRAGSLHDMLTARRGDGRSYAPSLARVNLCVMSPTAQEGRVMALRNQAALKSTGEPGS